MHSRRELQLKLRKKSYDSEVIETVLDRLQEVGLINDEQFAQAYVESRQRRRPRGPRLLQAELQAKGVDRDIIAATLAELEGEEDPVLAAERALKPKLRGLRKLPPEAAKQKASQFLLRRGFPYGIVEKVVSSSLLDT
ncbi:MAG: regulatory protein RecX, partial [Candidatus Eisenbacteria bacterium]|nr:regulatory protein RecX [Candidatus Eisenbacteria bacterium]